LTNPSTNVEQHQRVGNAGFEFTSGLKVIKLVMWATLFLVFLTFILAVVQYVKNQPSPLANRPECPHDRDTVWIAGKYTNVPEFHDCQRLILKKASGLIYGELAAVFLGQKVIEGTASVVFKLDPSVLSVKIPTGGSSTAVPGVSAVGSFRLSDGVITTTAGGTATTQATTAVATPWVEVVTEGAYPSLGIGAGFNCMFIVEHKDAAGTVLKTDAKMVNVGADEIPCDTNSIVIAPGTTLSVFPNAAAPGATIPAATRWVWSPSDSTQLIGIPCASGWCDVGPHPGPPAAGAAFPQAVKGWYDEQYLADYTTGSGLVVSSVVGTVFPEPGLETRDSAYYSGTFKDAAHVAMTAALNKYESRYAFGNAAANGATSSMATVALCYGEREKCLPAAAPAGPQCVIPPQMPNLPADAAILHPWWARVTAPGGSKVNYFCTGYRGLPKDFKMPGVVRWRWRAKDETIWIPCAQGCCEVDV
jgi:hypothetical protein